MLKLYLFPYQSCNLDVKGCSEKYPFPAIGNADHADLSKQEILEEETGEQFRFKDIIAHHQTLKSSDHACKESLPNPMITWEYGSKTNDFYNHTYEELIIKPKPYIQNWITNNQNYIHHELKIITKQARANSQDIQQFFNPINKSVPKTV